MSVTGDADGASGPGWRRWFASVSVVAAGFTTLCRLGLSAALALASAVGAGFLTKDSTLRPILALTLALTVAGSALTYGRSRRRRPPGAHTGGCRVGVLVHLPVRRQPHRPRLGRPCRRHGGARLCPRNPCRAEGPPPRPSSGRAWLCWWRPRPGISSHPWRPIGQDIVNQRRQRRYFVGAGARSRSRLGSRPRPARPPRWLTWPTPSRLASSASPWASAPTTSTFGAPADAQPILAGLFGTAP